MKNKRNITIYSIMTIIILFQFVWAVDSNGIWHEVEDVKPGIFGNDEGDLITPYTMNNPFNLNADSIFNGATNTFTGSTTFDGPSTFNDDVTFNGVNTFENDNTFNGANTFDDVNTFNGISTFTGQVVYEGRSISDLYDDRYINNIGQETLTGDLTITGRISAAEHVYTSDERLKTNIHTLESSLDKLNQLRGVSFNWESNNNADIGFIAQEVEMIYPELITENKEGIKGVKYGNIAAILVEAVKEQQKEINKLKVEIERLKNE